MTESKAPEGSASRRRYTFPRTHRLKRRRLVESLFDRERSDVHTQAAGGVRILYRTVPRSETGHDVPVQVGFAPGGRVKSGVRRNRVRRLLREGYRQEQHRWLDRFRQRPDKTLIAMLLFRGHPERNIDTIQRDVKSAMSAVAQQFDLDRRTDAAETST